MSAGRDTVYSLGSSKALIPRHTRYAKEEFARRRDEIYDRDIRPRVALRNKGKYVAIDIETGGWEMDPDALAACERLIARVPDSQTWLARMGHPCAHHIGGPRHRVCSLASSAPTSRRRSV